MGAPFNVPSRGLVEKEIFTHSNIIMPWPGIKPLTPCMIDGDVTLSHLTYNIINFLLDPGLKVGLCNM